MTVFFINLGYLIKNFSAGCHWMTPQEIVPFASNNFLV